MPPKRRDRDSEGSKNSRMEHIQSDHELFLQAFEKPTQIYRYLRTRNMISPVFLHRNLTYMKERMAGRRGNRERIAFKVDSLLAKKLKTLNETTNGTNTWLGDYMTLMFLGYFDKSISENNVVEVETFLSKISYKKRKDSFKAQKEPLGTSLVKINPDDSAACQMKIPAVSVPTENFKTTSGALNKSYILQLNATVSSKINVTPSSTDAEDVIEEPSAKRLKPNANICYESELVVFDKQSRCLLSDGEYELSLQETMASRTKNYSPKKHPTWENLPENGIETLDKMAFERFKKMPVLKFRLVWTKEKSAELVDRPLPITIKKPDPIALITSSTTTASAAAAPPTTTIPPTSGAAATSGTTPSSSSSSSSSSASSLSSSSNNKENEPDQNHNGGNLLTNISNGIVHQQSSITNGNMELTNGVSGSGGGGGVDNNNDNNCIIAQQMIGVDYCFIYNNNTRQQTEACDDYRCPWCSLNCIILYALLKHLKLCHARFNFTYVPNTQSGTRARIDVCINELFDGSYTGSPHDLIGPSGFAFSRAGPVRRTIVTRILVCRPRRQKPNLSEFLEIDENELNSQRPYITGHNRLYHHTMTCLPVHPKELDIDSEGESDPAWLQHKTMMMIDEFTDVNEGEKELMKMWNLHIMKNGYVGDIQIPLACDMFIDQRGKELLRKNLYKNFVLHMCNLSDYGLVSPEVQYNAIQKLQRMLSTYDDGRQVIADARINQLEYWHQIGYNKHKLQIQQQLQEHQQKKAAAAAATTTATNKNSSSASTPLTNKQTKKALSSSLINRSSAGGGGGGDGEDEDDEDNNDVQMTLTDEKKAKIKTAFKSRSLSLQQTTTTTTGKQQRSSALSSSLSATATTTKKTVSKQASEYPVTGRRKSLGFPNGTKDKNITTTTANTANNSNQNKNGIISNKRRYSHLRDSLPRRRSVGVSLLQQQQQNGTVSAVLTSSTTSSSAAAANLNIGSIKASNKLPPNRRNSVASIGNMTTSRKRMSLQLTKVDNK